MMLTLLTTVALATQTPGPQGPANAGPSGPARDDFFLGANQRAPGGSPGPAGPAAAPADTTRTYDVRALGLAVLNGDDGGAANPGLRLAPTADIAREAQNWGGNAPGLGDDRWVNLAVDLLGRMAQAEGRMVVVRSDGQLVVTGPPELHEAVDGLLGLLTSVAMEEGRLAVDVLRLPKTEAAALSGVILTRARAEELAGRALERFEVALREDALANHARTRSLPVLIDYSVEVASGAAISDPTVVESVYGTQLVARAAPGRGGVHLALAVKRNDLTVGRRTTGVQLVSRHVGDDGRAITSPCAALGEDPEWTSTAFATTCFLPEGGALVLQGADAGDDCEVLVLRLVGPVPSAFRMSRFADGGAIGLVHLGALAPPVLSLTGRAFVDTVAPVHSLRIDNLTDASDLGLLDCEVIRGDLGGTRDGLVARLVDVDMWEIGDWLAVRGGGELAALGDALRPPARQFAVEVAVEHKGVVSRRARVPMLLGESAAAVLTRESLDAVEFDVEIAERSATTDPNLSHVFDGLVCAVKALPLPDGRIVLDLAGSAQVAGARRVKPMDDEFVPVIEERDIDRLGLRARRVLSASADGSFRAVLGETSGPGLRVTVTLTPVPNDAR